MKTAVNLAAERRKQIITLAAIGLSYVPFLALAKFPQTTDADSIIRYLASQTGYMAAVLLLWQFILGTRAISGFVHKDQVWALNVHKKLGISGIALVVAHPLLVMYAYSEDLLFLFYGDLSTEFGKHVAFGRIAFLLFLIIWFSSAVLRAKIGYRPWKYIHYLTYLIMPFVLLHPPEIGSFYLGQEAIRTGWYVIAGVFFVTLLLRVRQLFTYGQYPYKLVGKKEVAEDIYLYTLAPLKKRIAPHSGQFVYVRRGFWSEEHPFSVANYSAKTGNIMVAAKVFGNYTKKLSNLPEGSVIYLDGAYGVFTQEIAITKNSPVTLIAGGIGITPFIQHALGDQREQITLFNANRSRRNIAFGELLKKALGERYIDVLSEADDKDKSVQKGYVTAELIQKKLGKENVAKQHFYICGPPRMMQLVKDDLRKAGVSPKRIHTEEFGF